MNRLDACPFAGTLNVNCATLCLCTLTKLAPHHSLLLQLPLQQTTPPSPRVNITFKCPNDFSKYSIFNKTVLGRDIQLSASTWPAQTSLPHDHVHTVCRVSLLPSCYHNKYFFKILSSIIHYLFSPPARFPILTLSHVFIS